jgi:hypothetical protein
MSETKVECKYLKDTNCLSIVSDDEAKEVRKISCNNDNEQSCCYLCSRYQECEISCNFLGENKNKSNKKQPSDSIEENKIRVLRCPLCNSKMLHSEIKLRIGGWSGIMQALPLGSLGELGEKLLPVVLYFCPKCGKLEFMAQVDSEREDNQQ